MDFCIAAKTVDDVVAFRNLLREDNFKNVPRCSPTVQGEYYIRVIRSTADGTYRADIDYWVTVLLMHRTDHGVEPLGKPIVAPGKVRKGDAEQKTVDCIVSANKLKFEREIGERMKGR